MAFTMPQQISKNSANLSKLTKGVGEFYDEEKRIEIVLDENDKIRKNITKFMMNVQPATNANRTDLNFNINLNSKQEINLPKTFTTRKGALILFSEEIFSSNNNNDNIKEPSFNRYYEEASNRIDNQEFTSTSKDTTIKTVNDLQRNVLYYGITPKDKLPYLENETLTKSNYSKNFSSSLASFDETTNNNMNDTMFSLVNLSTKNLLGSKNIMDVQNKDFTNNSLDDKKLQRINRGLSAKRYLNNLTKHWDQSVLETFISDGKIKSTDTADNSERKSSKRKHIDDDLSAWPQAYRFDPNWSAATVDMRSYRFVKAQDFNLSKDETRIETRTQFKNSTEDLEKPKKKKSAITEPIKIFDPQHLELSYKNLATEEKEKVLSELLFHSALNNIKQQQLDDIDDSISYSVEKQHMPKVSHNDDKQNAIDLLSPKLNQRSINFELDDKSFDSTRIESKRSSHRVKTDSKPVYMFNKLAGAPWVSKKIPRISSEDYKQNESFYLSNQSSKKSVITPILQMENSPQPKSVEQTRKNYLNRLVNTSGNSLKKDQIRLNSQNETYLMASPSQSFVNKEKSFNALEFNPIHEGDVSPHLDDIEQNNLFDIPDEEHAIDLSDLALKPLNLNENFDSTGHHMGEGEKITPIAMYLEEMRSVEDDFALDDSFAMKKDSSIKQLSTKHLEQLVDTKSNENLSTKLVNSTAIQESQSFKNNIQNIQTEKLQQPEPSLTHENSFEESKRILNLDRRLKRFTRPSNSRKNDLIEANEDKQVINLKEKRHQEKKLKFMKNENSNYKPNKSVVINETTRIYTKKEPTSPPIQLNQSNSPQQFTIPGIQLSKDSVQNDTSKLMQLDYKDDLSSELSYRNQNLPMQSIRHSDLNDNQLSLRSMKQKSYEEYGMVLKDKLPLPKLNFNQEKENMMKLTDEKKFKLVYLDDEYAKVETIKLKPKSNTPNQQLSRKSAFDNSLFNYNSLNNNINNNKRPETIDNKENIEEKATFWKDWGNPNNLSFPNENSRLKALNTGKETHEQPQEEKTQVKHKFNLTNLTRRKVDWSVGDFDPRECFCLWSYETPPPPIVVDKDFAAALKRYAQLLARVILGKKTGGLNLSDDIKRALKANIEKLIQALTHGKMSRELLDEYKKIFKSVLAKLLKRKDLDNLEISDEMLMKLLEFPPEAFEIFVDPVTFREALRVRSAYLREQAKLVRNVITEKELSLNDFESFIDPVTGEIKYKLKADIAKKLGIPEGAEDMFEVLVDEHGNQVIRLKDGAKTITIGDTTYEMVIDPTTGKAVLKMVTKQKVGKETLEDIMRLANNMTPETRNRYFQELLKTAGGTMSDELRQQLIGEMLKNAENLSEETKENLLKDLMTNLVNQMPPELRSKMLADIMKATENIDSSLKEKMLKNLIKDLDQLPDELRELALKEIMSNMENLSSEQKQKLLEDILNKVEELGITTKESEDIKNQVLKEMLINAKNFDEETRNRIIQQVLAKATADGGDVPQSILEELVKQMSTLAPEFKHLILNEIKKSLESGTIDKNVLAELLKNSDELSPEMLAAIVANADKMDSAALQELIKNLDKLPDDLKMEVLNKMIDKMDSDALQELMKNLDKVPDSMKMDIINKMFDKMDSDAIQELMKNLDKIPDSMKMDVINKMFEKMDDAGLQELVKNLDKLSDEMKTEVLTKMLQNIDSLSNEVQQQLLKELLTNPNLIKDEALREKVIRDILKNMSVDDVLRDTANMTAEEKNKYYQELLSRAGDLSEETRQKLIELMLKNAENLDEKTRDNLLNDFMKNIIKDLSPEMQAKVLAELMKSTDLLGGALKQKMIDNLLKNMDDLPPELKQQALGELMKNLDDLSEERKQEIFKNILNQVDNLPPELRDKALKDMIDNMGNLSSVAKNKLLQNILNKVEQYGGDSDLSKTLRNEVLKEIIKNSQNLDEKTRKKILQEVMTKLGSEDVPDIILQELMKQMDSLPDSVKSTVFNEIKKNIDKGNLDPKVLSEMLKNAKNIPKDILEMLVSNAKNLAPEALAELVKNLNNLPDHLKDKALKDMLDNIMNLDPTVKKELLRELLKNPNLVKDRKAFESAILGLLENIEGVPENVRRDMLKNIAKNIKNLSDETKSQVLKEVFSNLQNSSDETREDVIKQLLKKMGQKELEEWIKNSDMTEEMKKQMLNDIKNLMNSDDLLWDSDDEDELEGLSPEERAQRKREIIDRRKRGEADRDDKLKDVLSKMDKEQKRDFSWVKMKQKNVLKNFKTNPDDSTPDLTEDQMEFVKAFYKLSDEEKAKLLENMSEEERNALTDLQNAYEKVRQKELTDTLAEAKNLAIAKLRERLALQKKIEYLNLLRIESNMFEHAQQLTRAYVFSYFDLIQWLDVSNDLPVLVA